MFHKDGQAGFHPVRKPQHASAAQSVDNSLCQGNNHSASYI